VDDIVAPHHHVHGIKNLSRSGFSQITFPKRLHGLSRKSLQPSSHAVLSTQANAPDTRTLRASLVASMNSPLQIKQKMVSAVNMDLVNILFE
jgi:hypothetical protein